MICVQKKKVEVSGKNLLKFLIIKRDNKIYFLKKLLQVKTLAESNVF